MANIKKCDFCGVVYEGRKSVFGSDVFSSSINISDYGDYSESATFVKYELCSRCMGKVVRAVSDIKLSVNGLVASKEEV